MKDQIIQAKVKWIVQQSVRRIYSSILWLNKVVQQHHLPQNVTAKFLTQKVLGNSSSLLHLTNLFGIKIVQIHLTHPCETSALDPFGVAQFLLVQRYFHELGLAPSDVTHLKDKSVPVFRTASMSLLLADVFRLVGEVGREQIVAMVVWDKRWWPGSDRWGNQIVRFGDLEEREGKEFIV